jgi:hypothetical protein
MAKIRDSAVTIFSTATASMVCQMPTHQIGDLLLAFVSKVGTSAFTTPAGWTLIRSSISAGGAGGVYAFRATTTTTTVTFTLTSAACCASVVSVSGCAGATVATAITNSSLTLADDTSIPYSSGTLTTTQANSLVFSSMYAEVGVGIGPNPRWVNVTSVDTGTNTLGVAYSYVRTSGTVVTGTDWYPGALTTGVDGRAFMVQINDDGNETAIDPYIPLTTTPSTLLSVFTGIAAVDLGTWTAGNARTITTIGPKSTTSATGLSIVATTDSGYTPFRTVAQTPGVSSTTNLGHTEFVPTTSWNLTLNKGLFFATFRPASPRDYIDVGDIASGGIYVAFSNTAIAATPYRAWTVGGQFSETTIPDGRQNILIQVQQTSDTSYGASGTVNWASVAKIAVGSAGVYGAPAIQWTELYNLNEVNLAGGTHTNPLNELDIIKGINGGSGNIPLLQRSGAAITTWAPIKFGGVDPCRVGCNLITFQYPRKADEIDYADFHVDNDYVGYEFHGLSTDKFSFTNCTFTSQSPYYWRFNASHSASALVDFSGSTIVNATVTLQPTVSLSDVTFNRCGEIAEAGNTLTDCTFTNTRATATQGAVIISGASQAALQAELNNFVNCTFSNNTSSNAAIKILYTGSGNVALSMTSGNFSGNSKDIAWWAPAGNSLTLNYSGTANPTSTTSTNNNIVTLQSTKTFTINNIVANTEIRILKQSDLSVIAGAEDVGNTDPQAVNLVVSADTENSISGRYKAVYSYNFPVLNGGNNLPVFVVAHSLSQQWLRSSFTIKDLSESLQISQIPDRQYQNL